jgi:hypothetical protein
MAAVNFIWAYTEFNPNLNQKSVKLCKNCKHFDKPTQKCKLFGKLDLVNGEIDNYMAFIARDNDVYCGKEKPKYYEDSRFNAEDVS